MPGRKSSTLQRIMGKWNVATAISTISLYKITGETTSLRATFLPYVEAAIQGGRDYLFSEGDTNL